jgi:predicted dehydrogenase
MAAQPLRAGVIGLGVGGVHADGYTHSANAQLVALCDSNEARLKERADQYHIPAEGCFTDYREMLAGARLDVVSVCLPNVLHAEAAIAALEAGCHVLCEKPLAPSTVEVQDMIEAARLNDRQLMVAYNYRYRADTRWIRQMVQDRRLGKIYHIEAWWRRETGIPGWGWFGSKQMSGGGALIDLGVHVLDLALWLLDFPAARTVSGAVRSYFGPRGQKVWGSARWLTDSAGSEFDVDDGAVGFIRLEGDTVISLHATWAEHRAPQDDMIRLEVQGTEGTAVLQIANYRKEDTLRFYTEMVGEPVTVIPAVRWSGASGHEALIADVLTSLTDHLPAPTDASQGFAAVRILEALYYSAQSGREVVFEQNLDMMA